MNWAESAFIRSPIRRRRIRDRVVPELIRIGGKAVGASAIDIGCGPGDCVAAELDLFEVGRVTAIDIDPKMVRSAARRLASYADRVCVSVGDVNHLDQPDGSVDAVFNFAVLHHVPDWRGAIAEIARVLAPGGRFFSQDHDVDHHDRLSKALFSHPPDRFDNQRFLDALVEHGLTPLGVNDRPEELLVVARRGT
jgi:ubiquinone/menaquinone biosynthesis C-methylase UbiE